MANGKINTLDINVSYLTCGDEDKVSDANIVFALPRLKVTQERTISKAQLVTQNLDIFQVAA